MEKIKSPTVISTLTKADGNKTTGWRESIELLMRELLPDDSEEEDEHYHRVRRSELQQKYKTDTRAEFFTEEEVREEIKSLKRKKSPGPDGIKGEIIQHLAEKLTSHLTQLYNECLKQNKVPQLWKVSHAVILKKGEDRDPANPKSYRPICLLNVLGKLQEKLLIKRLNTHRTEIGMNPNQFGFRKQKSTEDAVNRVIEIIKASSAKYLIGIFVDISGAFDNLWWPALFKQLRDGKCPDNLYYTFQDYCKDRMVTIKCPDEEISKRISKGCPQGSICGPVFWDIALEPCLYKLQDKKEVRGVVAYADDILIIIEGDSRRELENKSNSVIEVLNSWCNENKLKISTEKTTYMLLRGRLERNPSIKMGNTNIKRTRTTKYLGFVLDEKLNFQPHINYISGKANKVMHKIISIGQHKFHLPLKTLRKYHNAILVAIMSYGSSTWAHRLNIIANAAAIDRVQRNILIRLTGAYRTTAKDALLVTLGILPMHLLIQKRAATYWLKKGKREEAEYILREPIGNMEDIWQCILRKWQAKWDTSPTGRRTYEFLPDIYERLTMKHLQPNKGMVHYITGHGPYNETLHRLGIINSPICMCGETIGTPEHVMWECKNTRRIRPDLRTILAGRIVYEVIRIEALYQACQQLAGITSNFYKELYIRTRTIQTTN